MSVTPSVEPSPPPPPAPPIPSERRRWTTGRIVSLVIGCVLALVSLGFLSAGSLATWATNTQRDAAGYLMADTHSISTGGYAVTSDQIDLWTGSDWATPADVLGTLRVRATATNPTNGVFIGVAPTAVVDNYLAGVSRQVVTGWSPFRSEYRQEAGAAPRTTPLGARVWTAQVSGLGTQTLTWRPTSGTWTIVVMKPSGSAGVSVDASMGATVPDLVWFAVGAFVIGALLLGAAVALIAVPVSRASR